LDLPSIAKIARNIWPRPKLKKMLKHKHFSLEEGQQNQEGSVESFKPAKANRLGDINKLLVEY